jgi:pimeloyl-ACP methyl ester carboxylesterase
MTLKIGSNRKLNTTKGLTLPASLLALLLTGCSNQPVQPEKQPSENMANYLQNDFQQYIQDNQQWLRKNRMYLSQNPEQEILLNSPFELKPDQPNGKAALLVHGLSDSPFSFTDIAQELVEQGFLVRVILLPGHGSKPADLMLPELKDWTAIVRHHTDLLSKNYDDIWLGGYSTGANLVTIEAVENPDVDGLLLFSPAFEPQSSAVRFAPYARYLVDWAEVDPEDNIVKFESLAMNGAAECKN